MDPDDDLPTELEETFSVLGDETRLAILQTLWQQDDRPVGFADLRKAVGTRDSGNFSYHLDKLVPQFVEEADEGYDLTWAGARVVGAAVSGTYSSESVGPTDPVPAGDCWNCGGTVEIRYERDRLQANCPDCEAVADRVPAPPILASAFDSEEYPRVFSRYGFLQIQKRSRGLCLLCDGPVEQRLTAMTDDDTSPVPDEMVSVEHTCRACGMTTYAGAVSVVLDHPAVQWFLHEVGFNLRQDPLFEMPQPESAITGEDPVRVTVRFEAAGERLTVELDASLDVVTYERH